MDKLTIEQFGAKIKEKYPQYAKFSDAEIGQKTLVNYPEYRDRIATNTQTNPTNSGGVYNTLSNVADKLATGEVNTVKALAERGKKLYSDVTTAGASAQNNGATVPERLLGGIAQGAQQTIGGIAGGVGDIITNMISPFISQDIKNKVGTGIGEISNELKTAWNTRPNEATDPQGARTYDIVHNVFSSLSQKAKDNPQIADILKTSVEDAINIATLGTGKAVEQPIKSALDTGMITSANLINTGVKNVIDTTTNITGKIGDTISPVIDTAKNAISGTKNVISATTDGLSRIPSRVATNVAKKQAVAESIKQLPTKTAQIAVKDGVDLPDVKYLYTIPAEQKSALRTLLKTTQDFEKGVTKTNPIEVVGKPIIERVKQLESARGTIGQKLGTIADTLGTVTSKESTPIILNKLKSVNGLNGLTINSKGILNFADTTLATAESAADRKAIQSIFSDAIKNGTGKQKHLLRQELFESLGGKKKSLVTMTGTQEKAYEAIRKGLSDILDTKNTDYKATNLEYAKVAQPLSDINKFLKSTGSNESIKDMSAGLLARRLTSNAQSNPQIRAILQAMDNATAVKGKAQISVETLQDFYNLLDKYYNIAGKTGFQGQVTAGLEKSTSVRGAVSKAVGDLVGQTDAVKRKALENALMEALK